MKAMTMTRPTVKVMQWLRVVDLDRVRKCRGGLRVSWWWQQSLKWLEVRNRIKSQKRRSKPRGALTPDS